MRILFATYPLAFQNPGGGERVMLSLQNQLQLQGHEVEIFDSWKHDLSSFDLIHYFSCIGSSFWPFTKKEFPGLPLVVTPTLKITEGTREYLKYLKMRLLARLGLNDYLNHFRYPDHWLPTTEIEKKNLVRNLKISPDQLTVIRNGVEAFFSQSSPGLFQLKTGIEGPFILHVGRFHPVKNQLFLIRAAREAGVKTVFIGSPDKDTAEYYKACLAQAQNSDLFHFIPALDHADPLLASAYAAAAAFALPSRFETFGIAALEAASAGTPLILTDTMSSKEMFSNMAQFISIQSVSAWKQALQNAVNKPQRIGSGLRERLFKRFHWATIARETEKVYLNLLSSRQPPNQTSDNIN